MELNDLFVCDNCRKPIGNKLPNVEKLEKIMDNIVEDINRASIKLNKLNKALQKNYKK